MHARTRIGNIESGQRERGNGTVRYNERRFIIIPDSISCESRKSFFLDVKFMQVR